MLFRFEIILYFFPKMYLDFQWLLFWIRSIIVDMIYPSINLKSISWHFRICIWNLTLYFIKVFYTVGIKIFYFTNFKTFSLCKTNLITIFLPSCVVAEWTTELTQLFNSNLRLNFQFICISSLVIWSKSSPTESNSQILTSEFMIPSTITEPLNRWKQINRRGKIEVQTYFSVPVFI